MHIVHVKYLFMVSFRKLKVLHKARKLFNISKLGSVSNLGATILQNQLSRAMVPVLDPCVSYSPSIKTLGPLPK